MWALCYGISRVEFRRRVDFERYERGFFWTRSEPLRIQEVEGMGDERPLG